MLYEFGYQFHILDIVKLMSFFFPFFILHMLSSRFDKKIIHFTLNFLGVFLCIFFFAVFCIQPICSYMQIKEKMNKGDVCIVEGEVSNFKTEPTWAGHCSESFTIDNVDFCYYNTENYGYSTFLSDGGVVTGNGQKIRITYCEDPFTKKLVICHIEEMNQ